MISKQISYYYDIYHTTTVLHWTTNFPFNWKEWNNNSWVVCANVCYVSGLTRTTRSTLLEARAVDLRLLAGLFLDALEGMMLNWWKLFSTSHKEIFNWRQHVLILWQFLQQWLELLLPDGLESRAIMRGIICSDLFVVFSEQRMAAWVSPQIKRKQFQI